jgi:hypothetical protein
MAPKPDAKPDQEFVGQMESTERELGENDA